MATKPHTPRTYETVNQAAERTGTSGRYIRRLIEQQKLRAYRAGRLIRLDPVDVDALFTATDSWREGVA